MSTAPFTNPVVNRRRVPSAREAIFAAIANPSILAGWWGSHGFTNEIERFDFRPSGEWRLTMIAPDGTRFPNQLVFAEIDPPSRVVIDHLGPMHRFILTIELAAAGPGVTDVTWTQAFEKPDEAEAIRHFLVKANDENLERLEAVVKPRSQSS